MVAGAAVAHGRAPTSADPDLIEWFQNQHKANGAWCCDHADGHILGLAEWTYRDGAYWVLADGRWVQVDERQNLAVTGSLVGAYVVGYLETVTAYLISPSIRTIPVLLLLVVVVYLRPQGLLGRR